MPINPQPVEPIYYSDDEVSSIISSVVVVPAPTTPSIDSLIEQTYMDILSSDMENHYENS